jgi:hypothetical protein
MSKVIETADAFLAPDPRRYDTVTTPLGRTVRFRNLTEREKADYENSFLTAKGKLNPEKAKEQRCRLLITTIVNSNGDRILSDGHLPRLMDEKDGRETAVMFNAIREHCGFDEDDIEELEKNFGSIGDDDSPTDSPSDSASSTSKPGAKK